MSIATLQAYREDQLGLVLGDENGTCSHSKVLLEEISNQLNTGKISSFFRSHAATLKLAVQEIQRAKQEDKVSVVPTKCEKNMCRIRDSLFLTGEERFAPLSYFTKK